MIKLELIKKTKYDYTFMDSDNNEHAFFTLF